LIEVDVTLQYFSMPFQLAFSNLFIGLDAEIANV
jgi:hypothetical protein